MATAVATTPKARGILFSAPMVRAILDGRKTMTRRLVNPQPEWSMRNPPTGGKPEHVYVCPDLFPTDIVEGKLVTRNIFSHCEARGTYHCLGAKNFIDKFCPYHVGDELWVRETWNQANPGGDGQWELVANPRSISNAKLIYLATHPDGEHPPRWRASIHMPRWASRITLRITGVKVERLHAITEADVLAEGIDPIHIEKNRKFFHKNDCPGIAFGEVWDRIHGPGAWRLNPWVWCVLFERLPFRKPEDR